MATVRNTISLQDQTTKTLKTIRNALTSSEIGFQKTGQAIADTEKKMYQLNQVITTHANIQKALRKNFVDYDEWVDYKTDLNAYAKVIKNLREELGITDDKVKQLGQSAKQTEQGFKSWQKAIITANQAISLIQKGYRALKSVGEKADAYNLANSKLGLITNNLEEQKSLQDQIYQSALRSRGTYTDMANSIAKMSLNAKNMFKNTNELVAFNELLNKSLVTASSQEKSSAMYQLTHAFSSGKLQGEEFKAISKSAPGILEAVKKYTELSANELKKLSSEGRLSAQVIKNAMLANADLIEERFKKMPVTFEQTMTNLATRTQKALSPLATIFSQIINSQTFNTVINGIVSGIQIVVNLIMRIVSVIQTITKFVQTHWNIVRPILVGIGTLLTAVGMVLLWQTIALLPAMIAKVASLAIAWLAVNWPVLLVMLAIIGLIYVFINFSDVASTVLGYIGGLFGVLWAFIYNKTVYIWNLFASFAEFLINVFIDPIYAIKKLFYDLSMMFLDTMINMTRGAENFAGNFMKVINNAINWVLKGINLLIDGLNMIPGFEIGKVGLLDTENIHAASEAIQGLRSQLTAPVSNKNVVSIARMQQMDYTEAGRKGFEIGTNVSKSISHALKGGLSAVEKYMNPAESQNFGVPEFNSSMLGPGKAKEAPKLKGGKLDEVGKIGDDITISDEDLKYLRDISKAEFINRYTTLRPNMTVNFGDVRETADIKSIMTAIEDMTENALASVLVGG